MESSILSRNAGRLPWTSDARPHGLTAQAWEPRNASKGIEHQGSYSLEAINVKLIELAWDFRFVKPRPRMDYVIPTKHSGRYKPPFS
eukprot:3053662-Amphidinium_carterae.1